MAALMSAGILTTLLAPRPEETPQPVIGERTVETLATELHIHGAVMRALEWMYRAAVVLFVDFFAKHGWNALFILALVGTYRLSDFVMGVMASNTFYIDLGYSLEIIAAVVKFAGIWLTILGVMAGGFALMRFGTTRALLIGIVAAIVANLAYAWLATRHGSVSSLAIALGTENFASGFAGTALIAYMSGLTSHAFTATQYALFSSFYALPGKLLGRDVGMDGGLVHAPSVRRRDHRGAGRRRGRRQDRRICPVFRLYRGLVRSRATTCASNVAARTSGAKPMNTY